MVDLLLIECTHFLVFTAGHKLPCQKMNLVNTKNETNICIQEYIYVGSHQS